jgi:diadenosine tetraphosphatase ApaH/serine/threonine PP2A family protein phosphatase
MAALHGAASRINRWVFASTPAAEKRAELDLAAAEGVVAGHCGLPFVDILDGRLWCNAGTVGLPANDGTPRTWYAILEPERAGEIRVTIRPLTYDHAKAAQKFRRSGLSEAYARALAIGLWPSADVLPAAARAATGRALTMSHNFWLAAERDVAA